MKKPNWPAAWREIRYLIASTPRDQRTLRDDRLLRVAHRRMILAELESMKEAK